MAAIANVRKQLAEAGVLLTDAQRKAGVASHAGV